MNLNIKWKKLYKNQNKIQGTVLKIIKSFLNIKFEIKMIQ